MVRDLLNLAAETAAAFTGETVTYLPLRGDPREITVRATRRLAFEPTRDGEPGRVVELLAIVAEIDAATGIDHPQLGDRICDPDDSDHRRPYMFSGEKSQTKGDFQTLTFHRVSDATLTPEG